MTDCISCFKYLKYITYLNPSVTALHQRDLPALQRQGGCNRSNGKHFQPTEMAPGPSLDLEAAPGSVETQSPNGG